MKPLFPVYIPSKGRSHVRMTTSYLEADGIPFRLVVEPHEEATYRAAFPKAEILVLPESGRGLVFSRNWIWEHALASGALRHWQLDDNMRGFRRLYRGQRIPCHAGVALRVAEDFAERYENVALAGLNYQMFVTGQRSLPPVNFNVHVYSCTLILNALPFRYRGFYNEDVDLCLQAVALGWCTALVSAFMVDKQRTMVVRGGQTDSVYLGDGRLKMARELERVWPGVVSVDRRFKRPQHVVNWKKFDNVPRLRSGFEAPSAPDEYGLVLREVRPVESPQIRALLAESQEAAAKRRLGR